MTKINSTGGQSSGNSGVLRRMQRYFSHTCDGTDMQADWRSIYGRAPNALNIPQGSLTCPSNTDVDSGTPLHLVAFYDTLEIRR